MNFNKIVELTHVLKDIHNTNIRCKHFTFILHKNKILSIGINNPKKTHPKNLKSKYKDRHNKDISEYVGIHSELSAILKYRVESYHKYTLINTRIGVNGKLANSHPCAGCTCMLSQLNFRRIYYTTSQGEFKELTL